MKTSKAKDAILNQLLEDRRHGDCEKLAEKLDIPFETVYAYLLEMAERDHVKNVSAATLGHPRALRTTLLPTGEHFLNNGGYTKESRKWNWTKIATWVVAIGSAISAAEVIYRWLK